MLSFAMTYSDEELASEREDAASIRYADGVITVNSDEAATLYIAEYEEGKLKSCGETRYFLWDKKRAPLCGKFEISK